jgi:MerR family transcriptional regulator/heat shock protein HspR
MPDRPVAVYAISVAAELSGTAIQNLRVYERRGLVSPDRTDGGTRRYSEEDVERLVRIRELLDAGLNLAGVDRVLELEAEVKRLRAETSDPQR